MTTPIKQVTLEVHNKFMDIALDLARNASMDIPIAALIVKDSEIIYSSTNLKEATQDPTAHAEMVVIREAGKKLGRWRLDDVTLYTTLEPCPMCAGATLFSRIPVIVFGAYDNIHGAFGSVTNITELFAYYNPQVIGGIREKESSELLKKFFK